MDDFVVRVKQVAQYPLTSPQTSDLFLLQRGIGGSFYSTTAAQLLTELLPQTGPIGIGFVPPADAVPSSLLSQWLSTISGGGLLWNAYASTTGLAPWSAGEAACLRYDASGFSFLTGAPDAWNFAAQLSPSGHLTLCDQLTVARDPEVSGEVATFDFVHNLVGALRDNSVVNFNGRSGAVRLDLCDLLEAGGAPLFSPQLLGCPTAPTIGDPEDCSDLLATTAFVQSAICNDIEQLLSCQPFVFTFNGRKGNICLELTDIMCAGGAPTWSPHFCGEVTAPTPEWDECSPIIPNTHWVCTHLERLEAEIFEHVHEEYLPIHSGHATGEPTAPTPHLGDRSHRVATTEFVKDSIINSVAGVHSFNGRQGVVHLTLGDIILAGGAPIFSPTFLGFPRAPTPPFNDSSTRLATTAWARHNLNDLETKLTNQLNNTVVTFNGRHGAVTLNAADLVAAGGALIDSPAFTGVPTAPTASPGTATTQLATTAFVMAALAAVPPVPGPMGPPGPMGNGLIVRGTVATENDLPTSGNNPGDVWITEDTGNSFAWDGTQWISMGSLQGPTGPIGPQGPPGMGLTVKGTVIDQSQLPTIGNSPGDMWIDSNGTGWVWDGTGWVNSGPIRGPVGPMGPPGIQGPPGPEGQGIDFKGTVEGEASLPASGNSPGDMYVAEDTGNGFVWDGSQWVPAGELRGPQGIPGTNGAPGAPGTPGAPGADGNPGVTYMGTSPPGSPSNGQLWFNPTTNELKVWNAGSNTWEAASAAGGAVISDNPPANPNLGDLWWDPVGGQLYIFDAADQWVVTINQPGGGGGGGSPTILTSSLSSDVAMANIGQTYQGAVLDVGTEGTWLVTATITAAGSGSSPIPFFASLTIGSTIVASGLFVTASVVIYEGTNSKGRPASGVLTAMVTNPSAPIVVNVNSSSASSNLISSISDAGWASGANSIPTTGSLNKITAMRIG